MLTQVLVLNILIYYNVDIRALLIGPFCPGAKQPYPTYFWVLAQHGENSLDLRIPQSGIVLRHTQESSDSTALIVVSNKMNWGKNFYTISVIICSAIFWSSA